MAGPDRSHAEAVDERFQLLEGSGPDGPERTRFSSDAKPIGLVGTANPRAHRWARGFFRSSDRGPLEAAVDARRGTHPRRGPRGVYDLLGSGPGADRLIEDKGNEQFLGGRIPTSSTVELVTTRYNGGERFLRGGQSIGYVYGQAS